MDAKLRWSFASDERPQCEWRAIVMSESETETNSAAPMRLRAEPPRVTRLSRKVLAGLGVVAGLGFGGALI